MAAKNHDRMSLHPKGEQAGFDSPSPRTTPPTGDPNDDDPKSSGFVNEGDGPLPEPDQPQGPRD